MDQQIGDQLYNDADYMGETASKIISKLAKKYHEQTEDIEVRKLKLQQKIVQHKNLTIEIEEDRKDIKAIEVIIKRTETRAHDTEYMADYQRTVDRLLQYPKEQKHILERAKVLADNHGYYKPLVKKDLEDAIAKANGNYRYKNGKKDTVAAGAMI
jgi:hypothetical protein